MGQPQLLVGVNAGFDRIHTIIVRQESNGSLRLMGEHRKREVIKPGNQASMVERIRESILKAVHEAEVRPTDLLAIGIAAPGQIAYNTGVILYAANLEVRNFPLAEMVRSHFDCHVALINDIDAQAVGEQKLGAGKGVEHLVYLYVGHAIGSGIIIDGKLYTGSNHLAGEFGHTSVNYDGQLCKCEHGIGCLESISSRLAMGQTIKTAHQQGEETILAKLADLSEDPLDLNAAIIAEAIDLEDPLTRRVVEEAAEAFGAGIANVVNFLNPHAIILGGDVIDEIDLFYDRAIASARRRCLPDSIKNMSIVHGGLGTTAGAYGAAVFAKQHMEQMKRMAE